MTREKAMTMGLVLILVGLVAYATLASSTETEMDFVDVVGQGLIAFHISDIQGFVSIDLRIENETGEMVKMFILPRVVFYPIDRTMQNLVVIGKAVVVLVPQEYKIVSVPIACANMMDEQATGDTIFKAQVGKMSLSAIESLIHSEAYQATTFRIRQFALWLLISHPETRYDFAGLGFGGDFFSAFETLFDVTEEAFGALCYMLALYPERLMILSDDDFSLLNSAFTLASIPIEDRQDLYDLFTLSVPTKGELAQIYSLFETVGIDPTDFLVLAASTGGTT